MGLGSCDGRGTYRTQSSGSIAMLLRCCRQARCAQHSADLRGAPRRRQSQGHIEIWHDAFTVRSGAARRPETQRYAPPILAHCIGAQLASHSRLGNVLGRRA
eukprot:8519866-Pyramimonas_sp.AAC.1